QLFQRTLQDIKAIGRVFEPATRLHFRKSSAGRDHFGRAAERLVEPVQYARAEPGRDFGTRQIEQLTDAIDSKFAQELQRLAFQTQSSDRQRTEKLLNFPLTPSPLPWSTGGEGCVVSQSPCRAHGVGDGDANMPSIRAQFTRGSFEKPVFSPKHVRAA